MIQKEFRVIFSTLIFVGVLWAQKPLDKGLQSLNDDLVKAHQKQDKNLFRKLIHSKCPVDEAKVSSNLMIPWSARYQLRQKSVSETFDLKQIKFVVAPESVLQYQVWIKKEGFPEMESLKNFPVAKENGKWKILEFPCFDRL